MAAVCMRRQLVRFEMCLLPALLGALNEGEPCLP